MQWLMKKLVKIFQDIQNSQNKFLILLCTLIALILFFSFPSISRIGKIILAGLITLIVIAGIYTSSYRKRYFYISSITGGLAIILHWLDTLEFNNFIEANFIDYHYVIIYTLNSIRVFSCIIFLFFVTGRLIAKISGYQLVNADIIYGAIAAYLLLGITSAFLMTMTEYLFPNSFSINIEINSQEEMFRSLLYFSFVTLSSIGYGDITPITPLARTLSIILGISGQIYLTILVAILISKYLNCQQND